jgi:diguanylate cyclase (GGDEF)-like protein/putative nucleotidyltransferase with HDIG domain
MSIELTFEEQQQLAETFQRADSPLSAHERWAELIAAGAFAAAVAGLWLVRPPGAFAVAPAAICFAVLVFATRVRFDTPLGFTVATQLAFVPLLFAVPVAVVPVAVVAALALAELPRLVTRKANGRGLWLVVGNSWFAIGPAAVFAIAQTPPRDAGAILLVVALGAQFVVDFVVSALRYGVDREATLVSQLRDLWVYGNDTALSATVLPVAELVHTAPVAALAPVPFLALLATFARERHDRLQKLLELNNAYRGTALVLGDVLEADDGYTGEHSKGVVALTLALADRLGVSAEQRRNLEFAALLHDVGKIAIPKEIINKPGKLDPDEWTLIKTHTIEGQRMLDRVGGFMRDVGLIVRSHHERWDGTGYPDGLAGTQIPLEARIIACCDSWNAMRTDRTYRQALSHEVALAELNASAGTQLDPRVVDGLVALVSPGRDQEDAVAEPSRLLIDIEKASELPSPVVAGLIEDVRASNPVERLLEDSWDSRSDRASRREVVTEAVAAALFLAAAVPFAAPALVAGRVPLGLAVLLVGLYAVVSRAVRFPVGAGYVTPSYLVLVPMLLLLPASTVPLLAAIGLVLGTVGRVLTRRARVEDLPSSVSDSWHTFGPAVVLSLAGRAHGLELTSVYLGAFIASCLVDLIVSSLREASVTEIAPKLQARVIMVVWLVDVFLAPIGLLAAHAARHQPLELLFLLAVVALLALAGRDRNARIAEAHHRLGLIARERTRLQAAVHRLGDAFTAKLDLSALTDVVLHGAIDALDADAGNLILQVHDTSLASESAGAADLESLLGAVTAAVGLEPVARQLERDGVWALALPFAFPPDGSGALAVARHGRAFRDDERALMQGLVNRAEHAIVEILAHEALRQDALTDPLTGLGNRRKLSEQLDEQLAAATPQTPLMLMLFDLDGFKHYNDTFGHPAGDALLARLGSKLAAAVVPQGTAYRLGGDEFCVLSCAQRDEMEDVVAKAVGALEEHGEKFKITASCGAVLLPHEASTADYALQLADKRMYGRKHGRRSGASQQAHDLLIHIIKAKQPDRSAHASDIVKLAVPVGRLLGMDTEQLDELARAAELHDVGNVAIPDTILSKPGRLDAEDWTFIRQHTILGERILNAAPALRPIATIVRATHERWDGTGYPDRLRAQQIPLAARIIAVCDAYQAMTNTRSYHHTKLPQAAREELLRQAGRQFDPAVVAAFLETLDRPEAPAPAQLATADKLIAELVSHAHELLETSDG